MKISPRCAFLKLSLLLSLSLLCAVSNATSEFEDLDLDGVEITFELSVVLMRERISTTASPEITDDLSTTSDPTTTPESDMTTWIEQSTALVYDGPSNATLEALAEWLEDRYADNTTGYKPMSLTQDWLAPLDEWRDPLKYTVTYMVKDMDITPTVNSGRNTRAVTCSGLYTYELQTELCEVLNLMGNWKDDGWEIDQLKTDERQKSEIETVGERLDAGCEEYGKGVCSSDHLCYIADGEEAICMEKCEHFTKVEKHCTKEFIAKAECKLIGEGHDQYPYCDCGGWALMDDYYDGNECISASFIVGMAAGLGALVLVILIAVIACLATDRNNKAKQLEEAKYFKGDNPFDDPPKDMPNGTAPTEVTSHQQPKSMEEGDPEDYDEVLFHQNSRYGEEPTRSRQQQAFDNKAYVPNDTRGNGDVHRDKGLADLYSSDAFVNFEASLGHVDPQVDYSIKRPNIVVRPTGSYSNSKQSSEWDRL